MEIVIYDKINLLKNKTISKYMFPLLTENLRSNMSICSTYC